MGVSPARWQCTAHRHPSRHESGPTAPLAPETASPRFATRAHSPRSAPQHGSEHVEGTTKARPDQSVNSSETGIIYMLAMPKANQHHLQWGHLQSTPIFTDLAYSGEKFTDLAKVFSGIRRFDEPQHVEKHVKVADWMTSTSISPRASKPMGPKSCSSTEIGAWSPC